MTRGNIAAKQAQQPMLSGELFIDTSAQNGYQLYVGTGKAGNYEWGPKVITEGTKTIKGPEGAYRKIGTSSPLGFFDGDNNSVNEVSYIISEVPENPITGAVYVIKKDIQLSDSEAAAFINVSSDGSSLDSTPELKENDIIIYTGYNWVKINNAGGTAKETTFYNRITQAPGDLNASNIQDAIVALDSQKLAYKGVLFDGGFAKKNVKLKLNNDGNSSYNSKLIFVSADEEDEGTQVYPPVNTTAVELGTVEGTVWLVQTECTINGTPYEMGDFAIITANSLWSNRDSVVGEDGTKVNEKVLSANDVVITHVPGGTHDPSKIYIKKDDLPRDVHGDHIHGDEQISNVKEALKRLFLTKADLDENGKVPLAQLPDTIIGAMEFQGAYDGGESVDESDVVTLSDGTKAFAGFRLPNASDKSDDRDDDEKTHDDSTEHLVKGDYWIYANTNYRWDISSLVKSGEINGSGLAETDGKYYVTNGDWIVYDGDKWAIIDNTDAFHGIKVEDSTLQGTVAIKGQNRLDTNIEETSVTVDGQTVIVQATKAVLADEGVTENVIYKSGSAENRTAVASNLIDDGEHLTIVEDEGIILTTKTGDEKASVTAKIVGTNADATLKLPNIDTTIAANEDLGIVDAEAKGSDWFATMYRKQGSRTVIRDSFLKFLGDSSKKINGEPALQLTGIELQDETSKEHKVDILLSSDTGTTVQVLPRVSGYLLNSNSIIDCGVWGDDGKVSYPAEGFTYHDDKVYRNAVTYGDYQSSETADVDDEVSAESEELIVAHIEE